MTNYKYFTIKPKNTKGRFYFVTLSFKILLFPTGIYKIVCRDDSRRYVEIPARTIYDFLNCLRIGCRHAIYGFSYCENNRILEPSEWDSAIERQKQHFERIERFSDNAQHHQS